MQPFLFLFKIQNARFLLMVKKKKYKGKGVAYIHTLINILLPCANKAQSLHIPGHRQIIKKIGGIYLGVCSIKI